MARTRVAKKVEKLEKEADKLRKRAEKRGKVLQGTASDRVDDLRKQQDDGGRGKSLFALLLAVGAGIAVALKRKRDQELDEALWEEPRSL